MLAALFMIVLQISVASGIIILALVVFSSKLNKIFTAKWKFWVWLLLAARLLIPVSFTVPRAPVRLSVSDVPILTSPGQQMPHMPLPLPGAYSLTLAELAAFIWLAGTALFLLYHIIAYRICKNRAFRWSHTPKNASMQSFLNDMRSAAGNRKNIPLLISPKISSPMIIGFFNSCLLLPTEDYTASDLYYIVKHELIHIKRRDTWYKLLLLCANAVHWFNPVMYFMLHESGKDLEFACDEEVVKGLSFAAKKEYSDIILKSINRQCFKNTMLAACFHGGSKVIKARFSNILSRSEKRSGVFPGVIAVSCVLLAGTLITCDRSGGIGNPGTSSPLEYYYVASNLDKFPVDDIFISLSTTRKKDIKTTAAQYIENVAQQKNFILPDYYDQYFFIRKLKDENELEQLKNQGLADNRSQIHTVYSN